MKIIKKWDNVWVYYTGKLQNWTTFDSNIWSWTALKFKVWAKEMIEWVDNAVLWMQLWEKKQIEISPIQWYWEYDSSLTQTLRKKDLVSFKAAWYTFELWDTLPYWAWDVTIIESNEDNIVIDTNHELAWKTLIFDIEIVSIK